MTAQYYVVCQAGNVGGKGRFRVLDGPYDTRDKAQEWVAPMSSRMKQIEFTNALDIYWVKEYDLPQGEKLAIWENTEGEAVESPPCAFIWPEYNFKALERAAQEQEGIS